MKFHGSYYFSCNINQLSKSENSLKYIRNLKSCLELIKNVFEVEADKFRLVFFLNYLKEIPIEVFSLIEDKKINYLIHL